MHVGTHGSCVRPNNRAFVFHSPCADARTVRPYMPSPTVLRRKAGVVQTKVHDSTKQPAGG